MITVLLSALPFGMAAQDPDGSEKNSRELADAIIKEAGRHLGKPYSYGGNGPKSFDCTGFTCYVFEKSGYTLPRTSSDQARAGREIRGGYDQYQKGDLVIFGGRTSKKSPGHVGIFIAADSLSKSFTFIHASNSGVTISRIDEPYFAQRFLGVRRILPDFPPDEKEARGWFNLQDLFKGRSAAARDSVLNAVRERNLILFPDGSWAIVGEDGSWSAPPGDRDFILNADGTWRTEEATTALFYTVRAGDTLAKIARRHGISVESLCEMNGLDKRSVIRLGDRLRVQ